MRQKGPNGKAVWKGRFAPLAIVLIAAVGLLGVGIIFSSSVSASRVAGQARSLHWTNATLGTSGIARAAVAQAIFFSFDQDSTQAKALAISMEEAVASLDALESLLSGQDVQGELSEAIAEFIDAGRTTLDEAESGNPGAAELSRLTVLEPAFDELTSLLADQQDLLVQEIAESEASAGRISQMTQLAITLVLPATAMFIYWMASRRRNVREQAKLRRSVETERRHNRAKDEFIAGLSHELRTPLTAIYGFSELLLDDPSLSSDAEELVGLINSGSADLSRMVDDLLAAARLDANALTSRPARVDLAEQAELVAEPYRRTGEAIEVKVPRLEVYTDPVHVRQIIHNLVSNARRHGGSRIIVSGTEQSGRAILVVSDDGDGVPEDAEERLFQRFSNRGREALVAGSVGLGLAISQELARSMGGVIRYERVDGWTTFSLQLPLIPRIELGQDLEALGAGVV